MYKTSLITLAALALAANTAACVADTTPFEDLGSNSDAIVSSAENDFIGTLTQQERTGTVQFVNSGLTTQQLLDEDCGLHSDAAKHITRYKLKHGWFHDIYQLADVHEVGVYNLSKTVACAVANGFIATETTVSFWSLQQVYDYDQDLGTDVDALIQAGGPCDPCVTPGSWQCNPLRFGEVEVHLLGGQPVSYDVELLQMIDPEGGIQLMIHYTLDANGNVTDAYCDV